LNDLTVSCSYGDDIKEPRDLAEILMSSPRVFMLLSEFCYENLNVGLEM